jgi:hypothetical protein
MQVFIHTHSTTVNPADTHEIIVITNLNALSVVITTHKRVL